MGTVAAPRLDERLRRYIAGSPRLATAADVTRGVGDLAWDLGLPRPSYQAVRLFLALARDRTSASGARQTAPGKIVLKALDVLYEYPGPGLAGWYRRYLSGAL
ncbi:MAG TPA: hypothetical protein VH108_07830 [Gaiellaceae bacterium]|jgi:hypothetical protein|nr:hypothetical protein [Gaiellaceae bacterium]